MDATVPPGAALLLDFIASKEAPRGYDTVYANRMDRMPKPLTSMTFDEVVAQGPWRTKAFGSSACGRYQFMRDTLDKPGTLADLKGELGLTGRETFSPDLQDRLGLHLLRRRGYDRFMAGALERSAFGLRIAQEWASFPVLAPCTGAHRAVSRGQSFYAGDGLNKALVAPEAVEAALDRARAAGGAIATKPPLVATAAPPIAPRDNPTTARPAPTGGLSSAPSPAPSPWWIRLRDAVRSNMKKVA